MYQEIPVDNRGGIWYICGMTLDEFFVQVSNKMQIGSQSEVSRPLTQPQLEDLLYVTGDIIHIAMQPEARRLFREFAERKTL